MQSSYSKWLNHVDEIEWHDYLRKYDSYSIIPYEQINGRICVREDILHSELVGIVEKYIQGIAPIGGMWLSNGGYCFDYRYINLRDDYSLLGVSRYITYDLISYYSKSYIPPKGYDEYILCDAITAQRVKKIRIYLKWNNQSGLDILDWRAKLKI